MVEAGRLFPAPAQRTNRVDDDGRLLDRVDRSAAAPVRLADLRVPRAPGDAHHAILGSPARDPDVEAGRLRHDGRVGPESPVDERGTTGARRLLVGVRRDE